jgi:hypothetical protein
MKPGEKITLITEHHIITAEITHIKDRSPESTVPDDQSELRLWLKSLSKFVKGKNG